MTYKSNKLSLEKNIRANPKVISLKKLVLNECSYAKQSNKIHRRVEVVGWKKNNKMHRS